MEKETTLVIVLEKKDYEGADNIELGDEQDICTEMEEIDEDTELGNVPYDLVDRYIPMSTNGKWEGARDIEYFIEQAVNEGLTDTNNFSLEGVFVSGYYLYYTKVLAENISNIAYNILVNYVNKRKLKVCIEYIEDIEDKIEELSVCADYNTTRSNLEGAMSDWINNPKEVE